MVVDAGITKGQFSHCVSVVIMPAFSVPIHSTNRGVSLYV